MGSDAVASSSNTSCSMSSRTWEKYGREVQLLAIWRACIPRLAGLNNKIQNGSMKEQERKYYSDIDQDGHFFPRDYIFSKRAALRENITRKKYNSPGTTDMQDFIRPGLHLLYYMVKMNDFIKIWWLPQSLQLTRLGVCEQNKLNANLTALCTF